MADRKQYMRDYRLKKKAEKGVIEKPKIKTAAERCKEYFELSKNQQPSTSTAKTAAERGREYRERQKFRRQFELSENQQLSTSTIKTVAERSKAYRKRQRLQKGKPSTSIAKTAAERGREFRERQKLKRQCGESENEQSRNSITKTVAERSKAYRERQKLKRQSAEILKREHTLTDLEFNTRLTENSFGNVYRLSKEGCLLRQEFPDENVPNFRVCVICKQTLGNKQIYLFRLPPFLNDLPEFDCITERPVSRCQMK